MTSINGKASDFFFFFTIADSFAKLPSNLEKISVSQMLLSAS